MRFAGAVACDTEALLLQQWRQRANTVQRGSVLEPA
jgi:hypothetical protein